MDARRTRSVTRTAVRLALVTAACGLLAALLAPAIMARGAHRGILPPSNPRVSLAVDESLWTGCRSARDYSAHCIRSSLALLNAGRRYEHLGPLLLPLNWRRLTVAEQLFVLTDLERTARGLPPDTGLAADWNAAARAGADSGQDPTAGGSGARGFQAVWAGGQPNPIVVVSDWVYGDGVFPDGSSTNLGCASGTPSGCWRHRDILLHDTVATACDGRCAVGAAYSARGFSDAATGPTSSYTEIFAIRGGGNPDHLVFTWAAERRELPACERQLDSCGWAGRPVATAAGVRVVRPERAAAS